jgi:hypothetical protein
MMNWFTSGYGRIVDVHGELLGREIQFVVSFMTPKSWEKMDTTEVGLRAWAFGKNFTKHKPTPHYVDGWDVYLRVLGLEVTFFRHPDDTDFEPPAT